MGRDDQTEHDLALAELEQDWAAWLLAMFPTYITAPFADHHVDFWEWAWAIRPGQRPPPYLAIWPRGGGKSLSAASAVIALGARGVRNYCVYVSESQDQADKHLADDIAPRLESPDLARWYPKMSDAALTKFGQHKGWRRNRLHTASGFVIDALGLDVASRGMRVEEFRPDALVFDDLDSDTDTETIVDRKLSTLARRLLPATTHHAVVIGIQNLVHADSIFARIAQGRAEILADAVISGPLPAIRNLTYESQTQPDGRYRNVITGGTPIWEGQGIIECQAEMDKLGPTVFLSELQQQTPELTGGMFDHVAFRHVTPAETPPLDKVVCWVDPAVTDRDESDSQGIQIGGIARDGTLYQLWSWEHRTSPQDAIQMALRQALIHGAVYVGIETDQGGDTWRDTFTRARDHLGDDYAHIGFRQAKAGASQMSKAHRISQMLADYERGLIVHVEGTHHVLERGLLRFPRVKPFDCVDASWHTWRDLRRLSRPARLISSANVRLDGSRDTGTTGRTSRLRVVRVD